ncbi:hypothetical protein TIFTF001_014316 [Ficus carica]|uniref:Uncharacterized protein n=1 Tax=Ficus carica TaxID=3494 RepID=A0AA88D819_FICCA|nr:hypothetical protein TIFTF001_014316 [Ficus carica]
MWRSFSGNRMSAHLGYACPLGPLGTQPIGSPGGTRPQKYVNKIGECYTPLDTTLVSPLLRGTSLFVGDQAERNGVGPHLCDSFWENSGPRVAEGGGHNGTGCAGEGAAQRVDLPVVGNITIPLSRKGEIKLPTLSDVF